MSYDVDAVMDCGGPEPVQVTEGWNYTYNVGRMLARALGGRGLNDLHGEPAGVAAVRLRGAVEAMDSEPEIYRSMNPENGWGCFDGEYGIRDRLVVLAEQFERVPLATVVVS